MHQCDTRHMLSLQALGQAADKVAENAEPTAQKVTDAAQDVAHQVNPIHFFGACVPPCPDCAWSVASVLCIPRVGSSLLLAARSRAVYCTSYCQPLVLDLLCCF